MTRCFSAVAELASAFASSKERHLETTAQGRAFMDATLAAWPCDALTRLNTIWPNAIVYPVAVGGRGSGSRNSVSRLRSALTCTPSPPTSFPPAFVSFRSGRPPASACSPSSSRSSRLPYRRRSQRRSMRSAGRPSAPISPACAMRPSTRGCFGHDHDEKPTWSLAGRRRRPGRLGQDRADGCAVQASARTI